MISNLAQWYTRAKLKGPDTEKLQKRITDYMRTSSRENPLNGFSIVYGFF